MRKYSINFKGTPSGKNSNFVKIIMVFYRNGYKNRPTKVINTTGLYKEWDEKKGQFKPSSSENIEKNKGLLELKQKYIQVVEYWEANNVEWSPAQLSNYFEEKKKEEGPTLRILNVEKTIEELFEYFNNRTKIKNGKAVTSVGNARCYRDIYLTLQRFTLYKYNRKLSTFYFQEINERFINDLILYISDIAAIKQNEGALDTRLRKLYGIVHYAGKFNIAGADLTPFHTKEMWLKMKKKKSIPKSINPKWIAEIEKIDRSRWKSLQNRNLDLFLFCYYTGMAPIDACILTWDSIKQKDNLVIYERHKYPKIATVPLTDKAWEIIRKYEGKTYKNYVFPLIKPKYDTEKKELQRVHSFEKQVNLTLKKVAKIIKCDEDITFYSARGTFIITLVNAGFGPMEVANMAGNSYRTIFNHYYKNTRGKEVGGIVNDIFKHKKCDISGLYAVQVNNNIPQPSNTVVAKAV